MNIAPQFGIAFQGNERKANGDRAGQANITGPQTRDSYGDRPGQAGKEAASGRGVFAWLKGLFK